MASQRFAVTTDLRFDSRRGLALIRDVMGEIARLRRVDDRIERSRMHVHRRKGYAEVVLGVRAASGAEAFETGMATLRAAIHASGGSTAAWEIICPELVTHTPSATSWRQASRRASATTAAATSTSTDHGPRDAPSWTSATVAARRLNGLDEPLPAIEEIIRLP